MILKRLLLVMIITLPMMESHSQQLTILTYNIRNDNSGDGQNGWLFRKVWLCGQIRTVNPGIFGIQEGLARQVSYIDSSFTNYRHIGVGRDDGKAKGEFSAIWYDTRKFRLIKQGTFWLSPTPEKVSVGWDAALERICTYGFFKEILSGKKFWVFNTHFDHIGVQARKNSAILILQKIKSLNKSDLPVILMGDFNTGTESEPFKLFTGLLIDSKTADKSMTMGPDGTFNNFDSSKPAVERIDFIFTGYGAKAVNYHVIRESREGRYASDHFPVVAEIFCK